MKVIIKCYGTEEEYEKEEAIREFTTAVACCEGSERDRYAHILGDLLCGKTYCTDID